MADKEMARLIRDLEDQGYEVTRRKSGHWCVRKDGTGPAVFMPFSTSDFRSIERVHVKLKKIGFVRRTKHQRKAG